MRRDHPVINVVIIMALIVLSFLVMTGLSPESTALLDKAYAQTPPNPAIIQPIVTRDIAREIILPKIDTIWNLADRKKGLRALQHDDLLPTGTIVRPAFGLNLAPQELTCQNACWLFFVDKAPGAHFSHPVSIILLDSETGEEQVMETEWWPEVSGPNIPKKQLFNILDLRKDPGTIIFDQPPVLLPAIQQPGVAPQISLAAQAALKGLTAGALPAPCDGCTAWAVIVCGYDDLPDTFDEDTDGIYAVLKNLGLSDDNIFFLSPHTTHAGVDRPTSKANVEWAINEVANGVNRANGDDKVLFFYSSHGGIDGLTCIDEGISAAELDGWLGGIKSKEMTIIIEACHSGSFIGKYADGTYNPAEDDLTGPGKSGRVVFTSASTDTSSYPDVDGPDDPNGAADIGSESIYGYVMAFGIPAADTNGDGAVSFEEALQYALANDVTRIRGDNTPQFSWTTGMTPAKVYPYCYPTSDPNGSYKAECTNSSVQISLDGTASSAVAPCNDPLVFLWDTDCPAAAFSNPAIAAPLLTLNPISQCLECNVWLTVTCSDGSADTRCTRVTVTDKVPPVITCPADRVVSCEQPTDPAHTGMAIAIDICKPDPLITSSDAVTPGACANERTIARTWTATDGCSNRADCLQTIQVVDTTAPVIGSVSAAPNVLWSPNHKMVPIRVTATATDNCSATPVCTITKVVSNEPENGLGDGDTAPDWKITGPLSVDLRAERSGTGNGRIYTITVTCTDDCGNSSAGTTKVTVPKSQKNK